MFFNGSFGDIFNITTEFNAIRSIHGEKVMNDILSDTDRRLNMKKFFKKNHK